MEKAKFDLENMSVQDLTALRDAAEAKRLEKLDGARDAILAEAKEKLAQLGLPFEAAWSGRSAEAPARGSKKTSSGSQVAAKYRGPNGEEWSGRGRLPKWLHAMEAEGRKRDEFRI
ncbi:H-NS histone family protein [Belnapia sp. T6]|uniref:H-NS histone family protein n=1 Tax=Belnapia mucosa TaxID=2804532 RepID=A0ABS1V088_9PROT|nr:H-NS histone family protein [Belnapia mucosa]MBL6455128.1 H-NS histone family protein [Belnapia mucosa]